MLADLTVLREQESTVATWELQADERPCWRNEFDCLMAAVHVFPHVLDDLSQPSELTAAERPSGYIAVSAGSKEELFQQSFNLELAVILKHKLYPL